MKKIAFPMLASLALITSAFAGQEVKESKEYKAIPDPCFKDTEFQLDLFGSYTDSVNRNPNGDGFGGGLAFNYFFMKYLGIGVDGNVFDGTGAVTWDVSGRIIARFPIETGSLCIAPYIFGGGGYEFDGADVGTFHAGGGLEWRATHTLGLFGEGRYTWGADEQDSAQVRAGVRFVF
mgnify:CR=1 FL=1